MRVQTLAIFISLIFLLSVPLVLAGTVTRSFSSDTIAPSQQLTVTLDVDVDPGTEDFFAFDETFPTGFSLINDGGMNSSETGHLKKVNVSDASDTSFQYVLMAPAQTGSYNDWQFGIYQIEGMGSEATIIGPDTVTVEVTPCSGQSQSSCTSDPNCDWCTECSGSEYSGGTDRCVNQGSCSYACNAGNCGASCANDNDCGTTDCDGQDGCYSGTYRDYSDVPNTCSGSCACTAGSCNSYVDVVTDNDGDNYDIECDNDCNDNDDEMNPGEIEICDGKDNNCNGEIDEGCDDDNDDYCDSSMTRASSYSCSGGDYCCPLGSGNDDCDDTNPNVNPGEAEVCDNVDNDCDGNTDFFSQEGDLTQQCGTTDVGACSFGTQYCAAGTWSQCQGNIDATTEVCNLGTIRASQLADEEADDDCNGIIDDAGAHCYCEGGTDPLSDEQCPLNGIDDDCNGLVDEDSCGCTPGETRACSNQFGVCFGSIEICPAGGVWSNCDDALYLSYNDRYESGSESSCDGYDNDCDDSIDEALEVEYFEDTDSDTYGDSTSSMFSCTQPAGYVTNDQDCNDTNSSINPGAVEICDGIDNNCDNRFDYADTPGDLGCDAVDVTVTADYYDGGTTDFSNVGDTTDIVDMRLEKIGFGKIEFMERINISQSVSLNPPFTKIESNLIEVNTTILPFLNKTARLFLYNLSIINPVIMKDDEVCPDPECQIINFTNGTLEFNITGFSTYYASGTCSDGTFYDECSATRPRFCDNGTLVNRAGTCGCPSGYDPSGDDCVEEDDDDGGGGGSSGGGGGGSVCEDGEQIACSIKGVCAPSFQTCVNGFYQSCTGPDPEEEICDGVDNDCDGEIDEGITCLCNHGDIRSCGPESDEGICSFGVSECEYGVWGSCEGEITPQTEICDDVDNDCDGVIDEDCAQGACVDGTEINEPCVCGGEAVESGYCCGNSLYDNGCPFPWVYLIIAGVIILIALYIILYFYGDDLDWNDLATKYRNRF